MQFYINVILFQYALYLCILVLIPLFSEQKNVYHHTTDETSTFRHIRSTHLSFHYSYFQIFWQFQLITWKYIISSVESIIVCWLFFFSPSGIFAFSSSDKDINKLSQSRRCDRGKTIILSITHLFTHTRGGSRISTNCASEILLTNIDYVPERKVETIIFDLSVRPSVRRG